MRNENNNKGNRPIKYRGKTVGGDWVFGNYSHLKKDFSTIKAGHYISNSVGAPFAFLVRPETVGQYTGMNDGKGKEIFEGDILAVKDEYGSYVFAAVKWGDDYPAFTLHPKIDDEYYNSLQHAVLVCGCKIVGNVFESPELLNNNE
ncbi:MAG: hypothetical protein KF862_07460 [Chitinophagaceae bacterium]|nr:hypothetical protein [Chitinophagaceae bacterium]